MKNFTLILIAFLITGCVTKPTPEAPEALDTPIVSITTKSKLQKVSFNELPSYYKNDFDQLLELFIQDCRSSKTQRLYKKACKKAKTAVIADSFFKKNFQPYKLINSKGSDQGLLTGYYEPTLYGSRTKTKHYKYPIYAEPEDLVTVSLSSVYPELKGKRLRGRVVGNKLIPYFQRSCIDDCDAKVIAYVDDKVDLFFLEVQGSGKVILDDGSELYVGYTNQNGHPYKSIGKYLINIGAIKRKDVSLQSIKTWLNENPTRVNEVLHANPSVVFFTENNTKATGALGIELSPTNSIAVDPRVIPLGSLVYISTTDPVTSKPIEKLVFAQDTGGAIKGEIRADFFWGAGDIAAIKAGAMKQKFKMWLMLPN
ncbi:MAG: hypothetical protein GQ570_02335 [Helicobacteraceae bacterium]|nr:hypothetical protein [Helicobacteraceae bacterium]